MNYFRGLHWNYFITFLLMLGFGVYAIYSSSSYISYHYTHDYNYFFKRHLVGLLGGVFIFAFFYRFNINILFKHYRKVWLLCVIVVLLPFIPGLGVKVYGSSRWVSFLGIGFQSSEIAKYLLIFFIAALLYEKKKYFSSFRQGVLIPLAFCLVIVFFVVMEPDVSTSFNLVFIIFVLFFLAGASILHLASIFSLGLPVFLILLSTKTYLIRRFSFLDPFEDRFGRGYHLIQSFVAFKNGGIFGRGAGMSLQKISSLPEAHTDFIYSIIVEELGAFGGSVLLGLFMYFFYLGIDIANKELDFRKRIVVLGFTFLLALEQCVHVFVVMGFFPTTGLPLPFISYGRTALIIDIMMVATILNIARENVLKQQQQEERKKKEVKHEFIEE